MQQLLSKLALDAHQIETAKAVLRGPANRLPIDKVVRSTIRKFAQ